MFGDKAKRAEKARLRALELQRQKEIKLANRRAAKQRAMEQRKSARIRFAHSMKKALPSARQTFDSEREREKREGIFSRASRRRREVAEARRMRIQGKKEHRFNMRADRITRRQQRRESRQAEVAKRKQAKVQRHEDRSKRREHRISARVERRRARIATRQRLRADRVQKWDDFKYKAALFLATTPKKRR